MKSIEQSMGTATAEEEVREVQRVLDTLVESPTRYPLAIVGALARLASEGRPMSSAELAFAAGVDVNKMKVLCERTNVRLREAGAGFGIARTGERGSIGYFLRKGEAGWRD